MKLFKIRFLLLCSILLLSSSWMNAAWAETPDGMLRRVTDRVMAELRHGSGANNVIEKIILPYIDFNEMARWVIGRNAWNEADNASKQAFVKEFRKLLVRSYTRSLEQYSDQTVEFHAPRRKGDNRVEVSSMISSNGSREIRMDYLLVKSGSNWKVYDVIIEGVSIIQGYRAQFAEAVEANGIQGAIDSMQNRNSNDS